MLDWMHSAGNWVVNVGLSGAVLLIGSGTWKLIINRTMARLRLEIDGEPDCLRYGERDWGNGEGAIPRLFVAFRLFNDSRVTAKQCQVRLVYVYELRVLDEIPTSYCNPKPLWWNEGGGQPYSPRDFFHGGPHFVDLLYTRFKNGRGETVLRDTSYTHVPIEFGRTYRFVVQATAEGAYSVTKEVDIRFGNTFDDITIFGMRDR